MATAPESWLVVWFSNGKLRRSTVCRSRRTTNRIANSFNEYAQMYNKFHEDVHMVGVISASNLLKVFDEHYGLPKHEAPHKLKAKRDIRNFRNTPVRGKIQ